MCNVGMEGKSLEQSLEDSRSAAARIGANLWQVEVEPVLEVEPSPEVEPPPVPVPIPRVARQPRLFPNQIPAVETPPPPERILEALLFVGGSPLTLEAACQVIRGFTPGQVLELIERLNTQYRRQNRPYLIQAKEPGYQLVERSSFRSIKEKLFGGPREARLSQPTLDVLSLVAYRQPISKSDLETLRGVDCGGALRQLVRLGLLAVSRDADAGRQVAYHTTSRFLELFGLSSLDDLPRLGESVR